MPSISINTNLSSLIAQQSLKQSSNKLNLAVERMSTGFKINHAKDNAANYSISTNMTTKIGAYQVAEDNVAMGLDLLSTANGSLDQISDKLSRLRALAEQSANGTYGAQSRSAINAEANALVDEIERLYNTTTYNGINLSKGKIETSNFIKDIERRDTSEMTTLESVDGTVALTSGTYSISTAEGLAKLATMTNNGLIGTDTEFVLANDIDLKEWCEANSATGGWVPIGKEGAEFKSNFDGNGFEISNLNINRTEDFQGLFGVVIDVSLIKNLGLVDCNIYGKDFVAGILARAGANVSILNCYVTGNIEGYYAVGGLAAKGSQFSITDSYSNLSISGNNTVGGLVGWCSTLYMNNCYAAKSNIRGNYDVGGLVGISSMYNQDQETQIYNSYFIESVISAYNRSGGILGAASNIYANNAKIKIENCGVVNTNIIKALVGCNECTLAKLSIKDCFYVGDYSIKPVELGNPEGFVVNKHLSLPFTISNNAMVSSYDENAEIGLQVGTKSDWASALSVGLGFRLDGISALRNIGAGNDDYLSKIDSLIDSISAKSTEFGAAQNRLESALDEISTQYENLVSSRSTLRDADISEVSSEYIRQQILQEASATLMSTANQNPAIALQLI